MNAKELLTDVEYELLWGNMDIEIHNICYDSKEVQKGDCFVCLTGARYRGIDYMEEAIAKGAVLIVAEEETAMSAEATYIRVKNARKALSYMSATYFHYPAKEIKTIGITGTKGKTTTAYLIKGMLEASGIMTGLIGTIEAIIGDEHIPAVNTTPESYEVQKLLRKMVNYGLQAVVMEVSSQAFKLHRVDGILYDIGVFTNLSEDHIGTNEHKDFEEYLSCKSRLFRQCRHGIVNGDSPYCDAILKECICDVETVGLEEKNDIFVRNAVNFRGEDGVGVKYTLQGNIEMEVKFPVPGQFSVYNSMMAIAVCQRFGVSKENIQKALQTVKVKGRMEIVPVAKRYILIIDYAHNAMSLRSLLLTLREYAPSRLVCLFGCGGNRSKTRRYEMGEVSAELADLTIVSSDNPRYEEPMEIITDIISGIEKKSGKYVAIPDRKEAIRYAMLHAIDGEILVLAGKGHEDYQEIQGVKHHMDERELIEEIIKEESNIRL